MLSCLRVLRGTLGTPGTEGTVSTQARPQVVNVYEVECAFLQIYNEQVRRPPARPRGVCACNLRGQCAALW